MQIGILGTGMVGKTLARKFAALGHNVMVGSRDATNASVREWIASTGLAATLSQGDFAQAAAFGDILIACTSGTTSIEILQAIPAATVNGKILIDVSNPLDFSQGMPVRLTIANGDSLGETLQRTQPGLRVVKALNTVNCEVMVDPALVPGEHDLFMAGNDEAAKAEVAKLLQEAFGWKTIHDLGGIEYARATEQLLPLWIRLFQQNGHPRFNFHITS